MKLWKPSLYLLLYLLWRMVLCEYVMVLWTSNQGGAG